MSSELEDIVQEILDREYTWTEGIEDHAFLSFKRGWPDFIVHDYNSKFTFCIEVKSPTDKVTKAQSAVHDLLENAGIPVIVLRVSKEWDYTILRQDILRSISQAKFWSTGKFQDRPRLDIGYIDDIYKELVGVSKNKKKKNPRIPSTTTKRGTA